MSERAIATAVALAACSARDDPHPAPDPAPAPHVADGPIEHEARCGAVRAVWRGVREDGLEHYERLTLEIPASKPWTLALDDVPRDAWSFDIFAPDCAHVLLLQSRTGPYHIVRLDRLAAYAAGGAPDHVLAGEPDPDGITGTGNFHDGAWLSSTEVTYQWGCCDPPIASRFTLR